METTFYLSPATDEPAVILASLEVGRYKEHPEGSESPRIMLTDVGKALWDIRTYILGAQRSVRVSHVMGPADWTLKTVHTDGEATLVCARYASDGQVRDTHCLRLTVLASQDTTDKLAHNLLFRLNRNPVDFPDWEGLLSAVRLKRSDITDVWDRFFMGPLLEVQNMVNDSRNFGMDTEVAEGYLRQALDEFNQRRYQDMMNWVNMAREFASSKHAEAASDEIKKIMAIKRETGADEHTIRAGLIAATVQGWREEGFRIGRLEDKLARDDPTAYEDFIRLSDSVMRLRDIKRRLDAVPAGELEAETRAIRLMLTDPNLLPRVNERMAEIESTLARLSEEEVRNGFRMRLEGYRQEGFDVSALERMIGSDIPTLEREFSRFNEHVEEARMALGELARLDAAGRDDEVESIRRFILKDPRMVDAAREMMGDIRSGAAPVKRKVGKGLSALIPGSSRRGA